MGTVIIVVLFVALLFWIQVRKSQSKPTHAPPMQQPPVEKSSLFDAQPDPTQREQDARFVAEETARISAAMQARIESVQIEYEDDSELADDYEPPAPAGRPVEPWGATHYYQVVGESHYGGNIAKLFQGVPAYKRGEGAELYLRAALVPAPDNPHDHTAVAVWMGGQHVGYLAREDACEHFPEVKRKRDAGEVVTLEGRIWGRHDRYTPGHAYAYATLRLPEPNGYDPANDLPIEPHVVLPSGSKIQVTKEDEHMDVLGPLVVSGAELPIAVTLHSIVDIRPRSAVDAIEVRLDGRPVGVLTPTQTANLKPLVDHVTLRGKVAVARAVLRGSKLKADVVINAVKAADVDEKWLDSLGPELPRSSEDAANEREKNWDWND